MRPSDLNRRRFLLVAGLGGTAALAAACQPAAQPAPTVPAASPKAAAPASPATAASPAAAKPAASPVASPAVVKPTAAAAALPKPELASFTYGINNPNYASQIVHFVALEKGYLKEAGFDKIEVITGDEYLTGTVGGSLLMAQGDTDVCYTANSKGESLPYLACYRHKEYRILGVGKGINSAADLKGKKLSGGPPGSRNEYIMKQAVRKLGLDPEKDIEWIPVRGASDGRLQAIVAGQLAGGSLFPRHEGALKESGGKFLVRDFVEMPQEGIFAKKATVEKNPNTITAYLAATTRARQWLAKDAATLAANKNEALAIMEKHGFKISDDFKALYNIEVEQMSPDSGFDLKAMDQLIEESAAINTLPKGFDWRKASDLTLLAKAQAAIGLTVRPKL